MLYTNAFSLFFFSNIFWGLIDDNGIHHVLCFAYLHINTFWEIYAAPDREILYANKHQQPNREASPYFCLRA